MLYYPSSSLRRTLPVTSGQLVLLDDLNSGDPFSASDDALCFLIIVSGHSPGERTDAELLRQALPNASIWHAAYTSPPSVGKRLPVALWTRHASASLELAEDNAERVLLLNLLHPPLLPRYFTTLYIIILVHAKRI